MFWWKLFRKILHPGNSVLDTNPTKLLLFNLAISDLIFLSVGKKSLTNFGLFFRTKISKIFSTSVPNISILFDTLAAGRSNVSRFIFYGRCRKFGKFFNTLPGRNWPRPDRGWSPKRITGKRFLGQTGIFVRNLATNVLYGQLHIIWKLTNLEIREHSSFSIIGEIVFYINLGIPTFENDHY